METHGTDASNAQFAAKLVFRCVILTSGLLHGSLAAGVHHAVLHAVLYAVLLFAFVDTRFGVPTAGGMSGMITVCKSTC